MSALEHRSEHVDLASDAEPHVDAELELTASVGRELVRLGLSKHAQHAREYYAAVRAGRPPKGWTHEMIVEWARMLRLPPHENDYPVKGYGETCGCSTPQTFTAGVFPGGSLHACGRCDRRWLVLG